MAENILQIIFQVSAEYQNTLSFSWKIASRKIFFNKHHIFCEMNGTNRIYLQSSCPSYISSFGRERFAGIRVPRWTTVFRKRKNHIDRHRQQWSLNTLGWLWKQHWRQKRVRTECSFVLNIRESERSCHLPHFSGVNAVSSSPTVSG